MKMEVGEGCYRESDVILLLRLFHKQKMGKKTPYVLTASVITLILTKMINNKYPAAKLANNKSTLSIFDTC